MSRNFTFDTQLLHNLLKLFFAHFAMGSVNFSQTTNHCDDWAQHVAMLVGHKGPKLLKGIYHRVKENELVAGIIVIILRKLGRKENMMEQIQARL